MNTDKIYFERRYNTIAASLKSYDNYKNKQVIPQEYANIFVFKSFESFMEFMEENIENFSAALEAKNPEKDAEILFRDKSSILVVPHSHAASRKWGAYSHWCTATSECRWYDHYMRDGTLYIRRFFDDKGALDNSEGYQLYIPDSQRVELNRAECRDMRDDTIGNMHDFFEGLPRDIVRDLEDKIAKFGGLNAIDEIMGSIYGEMEDNHVRISVDYELFRLSDYDSDVIDSGDDTTHSGVEVYRVGKDRVEISEEESDVLYSLKEFDVTKGRGIYVLYTTEVTPEQASKNANNKWHQAERDSEVDSYEAERALEQLLGKSEKYDYVIVHGEKEDMDLDSDMETLLEDFFTFWAWDSINNRRLEPYEFLNDEDEEGYQYFIYYQVGFDYTRRDEGARASNAVQRTYDKQMDLPFGF